MQSEFNVDRLSRTLLQNQEILLKLDPVSAYCLAGLLQLSLRQLALDDDEGVKSVTKQFCLLLQQRLAQIDPYVAACLEPREDLPKLKPSSSVPALTTAKNSIERHNVYTLYGLKEDGSEAVQPLLSLSRPPDWGDSYWNYRYYIFKQEIKERWMINHAHCWTNLEREDWEYAQLFSPFFTRFYASSKPPQICGRSYLAPNDNWQPNWGTKPPAFNSSDEQ